MSCLAVTSSQPLRRGRALRIVLATAGLAALGGGVYLLGLWALPLWLVIAGLAATAISVLL